MKPNSAPIIISVRECTSNLIRDHPIISNKGRKIIAIYPKTKLNNASGPAAPII